MENLNINSEKAFNTFRENVKKKKSEEKKKKIINIKKKFLLINTQNLNIQKLKKEISYLNKEEIEIIEKVFNNNKEKIEDFLNKIANIEKYKFNHDNLLIKKVKEQKEDFESKKLKIKNLNEETNYKDNNINYLKSQLKDYKNSHLILNIKLNKIQDSIHNISQKIIQQNIEYENLVSNIKNYNQILKNSKFHNKEIKKKI